MGDEFMQFSPQEIKLAQAVQSAAIPGSPPPIDGLEIATRSISALQLGGDFHMVFQPAKENRRSHHVGLAVGDVCGKGLPASLTATSMGHLLPCLDPLRNPLATIQAINRELEERTPAESFATLVFVDADLRAGTLDIWSAGHPPAVLWRSATGSISVAEGGNVPLGFFSDWNGSKRSWTWEVGDVLVLYSDGLIETRDGKGEMFGVKGIISVLKDRCQGSVEEIADSLIEEVHARGAVTDDLTLLVCRRTELTTAAEPGSVRVLLVDDHRIWRDGVRSLLDDTEFEVVGEAGSGREASEAVRRTQPNLVLLDIRMADGDGLEALRAIKKEFPDTKVVMLTTYEHPTYKVNALEAGASGYLLKGMPHDEMLASLRNILNGELDTDARALTSAIRAAANVARDVHADDLVAPLTCREAEILALVANGLSNHEIAAALFISEGTVKTHVEHVIGKLGVSDRLQAAVWAARHNLAPEIKLS